MSVAVARCRSGSGSSPAAAAPVGAQAAAGSLRAGARDGTTWEATKDRAGGSAAAPQRERGDGGEGGGGAGDRVDEVVVAGRGHGHGHHERMGDEQDAQGEVRGGPEADDRDEEAPADVHARHGRVRVEADPGERARVVACQPDRVGDPEPGNEARRRGRVEDVEDDRDPERDEEQRAELAVLRPVPHAQPDEHGGDQRPEPGHVVDGEEPDDGLGELLQPALVEERERALEIDQSRRMGERLLGIADRRAANREVGRVQGCPQEELDQREPAGGSAQ